MILKFQGHSDDIFGYQKDEYCNSGADESIRWLVTAPNNERLLVFGEYCPRPATGWLIGVARADEDDDIHLPDWKIWYERSDIGYSPILCIEVPEGTVCECLED